jgi:hypothetical protein
MEKGGCRFRKGYLYAEGIICRGEREAVCSILDLEKAIYMQRG